GNREIHALAAGDLQSRHANHLAVHVDDRTATRAGRNRRGDLNDAAKTGNVAHGRNDAVGDAAFEAERIADHDDALTFLRRSAIERKKTDLGGGRFDFQQGHISLSIDGDDRLHWKTVARIEMDLGAISALDDVAVGDDAIFIDEEAAAARKFLALRIEGFNGDGGWFDAANKVREFVLRARARCD